MKIAAEIGLAVLASAALALPVLAQEKMLRIDSGSKVQLCMDCDAQTARFEVAVLEKAGELVLGPNEIPTVAGVSASGARIANIETRFVTSWERGRRGEPRAFVLQVMPPLRDTGTYEVVLKLLPDSRPLAPTETVTIVAAAATLKGPDKLLVERTIRWPFTTVTRSTPLVVSETGKGAAVRTVTLQSLPFARGTRPIEGDVLGRAASASQLQSQFEIPAGRSATLVYTITDGLPLGETKGNLRLSAPEAAAVVDIPVEIRTRLSRVYLALVIIAGLLLSWQVKVVLQSRIQLDQARVAARTLLRNVEKDRTAFPDTDFLAAVDPLKAALETADRGQDVAAIDTARSALDAKWRDARGKLETRRSEFRAQAETWRQLLSLAWELPRGVSPDLGAARSALSGAIALDQQGKVGDAKDALDAARAKTAQAIHAHGRLWQLECRRFFDLLLQTKAGISDAILRPLKTASEAWRALYGVIEPAPSSDPETAQPLLRQIMSEFVTAREHLEETRRRLESEYTFAVSELAAKVDASLIAAIRERLDQTTQALARAADEPKEAEAGLAALLAALQQSWRSAFDEAAATLSAVTKKEVESLVDQRDFRGAADAMSGAALLGRGVIASIADVFGLRFASAPRAMGVVAEGAALERPDPYTALLLEPLSRIRRAKALRTFIVGGMFFVWAMNTSTAAFDGTVPGLLTALFSAFGLDVGVDALIGRIKGNAL